MLLLLPAEGVSVTTCTLKLCLNSLWTLQMIETPQTPGFCCQCLFVDCQCSDAAPGCPCLHPTAGCGAGAPAWLCPPQVMPHSLQLPQAQTPKCAPCYGSWKSPTWVFPLPYLYAIKLKPCHPIQLCHLHEMKFYIKINLLLPWMLKCNSCQKNQFELLG